MRVCCFLSVVPGTPQFIPDECSAENNTVTIAWQPHVGSVQDGYTLELDDGHEGDFRVRSLMKLKLKFIFVLS